MKSRIIAALVLLAALTACDPNHGSTKSPKPASTDQRFKNDCRLKGGTPVITRQHGQSQYNCVPPPGGWQ